jgi:hypothetical protein
VQPALSCSVHVTLMHRTVPCPAGWGPQVRSSHGVFLDRSADPSGFLGYLEERIAAVTLIPPSHGEVCWSWLAVLHACMSGLGWCTPGQCRCACRLPQDFNVLNYKPGQHYNSHMVRVCEAHLPSVARTHPSAVPLQP